MYRTHVVEDQVIEQTRRAAVANIRLPIGAQTVYITRKEALALATQAQASKILGESEVERNARLMASLNQMRAVAANPLLAAA